jgi:hypothetical protein
MSGTQSFTTATGRLVLSRAELVALAEEVDAHRLRGLDGLGLLHVGVDAEAGRARLERRMLDGSRADLLGSEAAWARQRLALLRLDRPGDRAMLVLRHEADRLAAHLLAARPGVACAISAVFDQPVEFGPLTTMEAGGFLVEDLDRPELADRAWACTGLEGAADAGPGAAPVGPASTRLPRPLALGLRDAARDSADATVSRLVDAGFPPADAAALVDDVAAGPLPLVRVIGWWRPDDEADAVSESALTWMVGADRLWRLDDEPGEDDDSDDHDDATCAVGPMTEAGAARALADTMAEVLR